MTIAQVQIDILCDQRFKCLLFFSPSTNVTIHTKYNLPGHLFTHKSMFKI